MTNSRAAVRSIAVNGRFLSQPVTGVQRYAFELLNALDSLLDAGSIEPVPLTVLVPPDAVNLPQWPSIRIQRVGRFTGQLWEQLDLPIHAHGTLLFTPCGGAPIVHRPHVITIHDAGVFSTPTAYTVAYRNYYKALQRVLSATASHILTVSEFSRRELIAALHLPAAKITAIPLSGEHILRCRPDEGVLPRNGLRPGRYIVGVGSRNPNKNLKGLIDAAAFFPPSSLELVVAGGGNRSIFSDEQIASARVRSLGFVNDNELRALYENAACFAFPSFYEGFGLPPLEALTLGCPVVVSNAASLPEIFGEAAAYCDPHSPEDIARQIQRACEGGNADRERRYARASSFTWNACARETWSIFERIIRDPQRRRRRGNPAF